jgi:hypothetical protein
VRTSSGWGDPAPGHFEADLVAHSGPTARGSYLQTLVPRDVATGWTECAPLPVREQALLTEVLGEVRKVLPFPLLGFDRDNDSAFMDETVRDCCTVAGVEFTRCRPYRKNDQAYAEQKNGAVVRERYHAPATPHQRLLADERVSEEIRSRVAATAAGHDPVCLLAEIRAAQARLVGISDRPADGTGTPPSQPTLEELPAGLRTAWREGEVRPTAKPKPKPARWRRTRADLFEGAWPQLRAWFEAEPHRTARELLGRLGSVQPSGPGGGQLRTLQRRLKVWRAEKARELVFGPDGRSREQSRGATGARR